MYEKYLEAEPKARELAKYDEVNDRIIPSWVPHLAGEDVVLRGDPLAYDNEADAIAGAKRFQDAILEDHG